MRLWISSFLGAPDDAVDAAAAATQAEVATPDFTVDLAAKRVTNAEEKCG